MRIIYAHQLHASRHAGGRLRQESNLHWPSGRSYPFNPEDPLEPNPLQLPLVRGRAKLAPPLIRGGWEGFEPIEVFIIGDSFLPPPQPSPALRAREGVFGSFPRSRGKAGMGVRSLLNLQGLAWLRFSAVMYFGKINNGSGCNDGSSGSHSGGNTL